MACVITIANYDPKSFIVKATGLIFVSKVGACPSGAPKEVDLAQRQSEIKKYTKRAQVCSPDRVQL
jgi:hypothetical protein